MLCEAGLTIKAAKQDASLSKGVLFPKQGAQMSTARLSALLSFILFPSQACKWEL